MLPITLLALEDRAQFDFYMYDEQLAPVFADPALCQKSLPSYHATDDSIDRLASRSDRPKVRLKKVQTGNIIGDDGRDDRTARGSQPQAVLLDFLAAVHVALLTQIVLAHCCRSVYIATPIYHGFGVAALFMGVILGAEMYFTKRFEAGRACALIRDRTRSKP